jgi:transcriptional regulator with XRE-family HTH domain
MLDKFAEELKQAREENGITLQQMAAKTRIDIKFLEAIDNGNFSFLPNIYVRAFIKQFAKTVGLDEEETIKKYESAKQGKLPEKVEVAKEEKKEPVEKDIPEPEKKQTKPVQTFTDVTEAKTEDDSGKKKMAMMTGGAVAGVVVLAFLIYLVFFQDSSQIIVEEKPYEEVLEESTQRYVEEEIDDEQITSAENSDSLFLQIVNRDSRDSAWVLVITDNLIKEDYLIYPGSGKTFKAGNNFKFILGNSGVIRLELNGENLEFEGRRKSVRYFKLDKNGLERLYSPPNLIIE